MKMHVLPPQEYLHECFEYLEDGTLMNKVQPRSHFSSEWGYNISKTRNRERKEVGRVNTTNYRVVRITYLGANIELLVHRIIWAMHNGPIPEGYFIDHEDTNRLNNRIEICVWLCSLKIGKTVIFNLIIHLVLRAYSGIRR